MQETDELLKIYEAQLNIPARKDGPQFFICPVGQVGSGKTTVINKLAEQFPFVRLSNDELRKLKKEHGFTTADYRLVRNRLAEKYAREGYSIAFDSNSSSPATKGFVEELSSALHVPLIWIHVNPPEKYILDKLRNYKHTWLFRDADEAFQNYFQQKETRQRDDHDIAYLYEIDTSQADLSPQIQELARLITQTVSSRQ